MSDFYEPWQPQVGDRVMFRPNPECPQQRKWHGIAGAGDDTASVMSIDPDDYSRQDGHRYRIWLDQNHAMVSAAALEMELEYRAEES